MFSVMLNVIIMILSERTTVIFSFKLNLLSDKTEIQIYDQYIG